MLRHSKKMSVKKFRNKQDRAQEWPQETKMDPQMGQETMWSAKLDARGPTKGKECHQGSGKWAQESPKWFQKGAQGTLFQTISVESHTNASDRCYSYVSRVPEMVF